MAQAAEGIASGAVFETGPYPGREIHVTAHRESEEPVDESSARLAESGDGASRHVTDDDRLHRSAADVVCSSVVSGGWSAPAAVGRRQTEETIGPGFECDITDVDILSPPHVLR
ncbi:hypothetical protein BHE74_00027116 [Ensete ventricosum]|nr:hypothetical protein BHE74_00027116 [Ensete ventricosum]RZR99429.1 hypothetical protein BHM03_00028971 [Ensete ventricosum]